MLAQRAQREVADVVAVEPDGPVVGVGEAQRELGGGRLAGPALADQRDAAAGPHGEREVLERGPLAPPDRCR